MSAAVSLADLKPEDRAKLLRQNGRTRAPAIHRFPKARARTHAIRALAVLAELDQAERRRVIRLMLAMNEV